MRMGQIDEEKKNWAGLRHWYIEMKYKYSKMKQVRAVNWNSMDNPPKVVVKGMTKPES